MEQPFRSYLTLTVKDLLQRIGFDAEVKTGEEMLSDETVRYHCEITLRDGQNLLIGQHGANVGALLHVVRLAVRKELPPKAVISIDVNRYFEEKRAYLEREALQAVREVEETGLPATLRPMLSFERKMIHTLLANHPVVATESVGSGSERKVLIKRRPVAPEGEGVL
jgi:spoIIIJ-associated protein